MPHLSFTTPLGELTLFEEDDRLVALEWGRAQPGVETPLLAQAAAQLNDYFDGRRRSFDLPLGPRGSSFQLAVWSELRRIPYGQVVRYGDLARHLATAPRAVGSACGRNPLPIIVPCHRVLAANGHLGGYSAPGGLGTKRFLLGLEGWNGA
jgi:methylated-DNA-[protein]-cysteine S-methyltransferase